MKAVSKEIRDEMIELGFLTFDKGRLKDSTVCNKRHKLVHKTIYVCESNLERYLNYKNNNKTK